MDRLLKKLPNTASRLIAMAALIIGSTEEVRRYMQCSVEDFAAYSDGTKEPAWPEFDRLVQLVVQKQSEQIEKNRALLAEIRAKAKDLGR